MRLPPWAIEAIRNGVADVARKASDPETVSRVKHQAAELLKDLPENAQRSLDAIVKTATETARDAVDQGRQTLLRWTERQHDLATPCLNASGNLFDKSGTGIAVSDYVLQVGCDLMRGDCVSTRLRDDLRKGLARAFDHRGDRIAVANHFQSAIRSISTLTESYPLVMHRSQAIKLPCGTPLPDCFADCPIKECGGVQSIEASDFDGIDRGCVILADDGAHPIQAIEFSSANIISVAICPVATFSGTQSAIPNAKALLESGIDLVVFSGGPLTGGVESGILCGDRQLIERIESSRAWKTMAASDAVAAMTLASMTDPEPNLFATLVETGEENLRSRAERLATQLTAEEEIASCQISDEFASLLPNSRWRYASRQLRLRHESWSASEWSERLRDQSPAVLSTVVGDDLVIDLRWLPARHDAELASALTGPSPAATAEPSAEPSED
jgi:L-seryl-tRNA(Ser) seleniumtransferase